LLSLPFLQDYACGIALVARLSMDTYIELTWTLKGGALPVIVGGCPIKFMRMAFI
jgi:hypothetical protein